MPEWTDEQLRAIRAYSRPVIVSAAAGSGKTAVLVERTIRLLCDEKLAIPADSLLAVTFTNDAASQMREKLTLAFENAAAENPESRWIQKQQSLLRLADICTINSFCFDMVRNNLSSTNFQNGIRIMDESEAKMAADKALDTVMENWYLEKPEKTERLISLFCSGNDSELRKIVLNLRDFMRSLPFKKLWCKNVLNSLENGSAVDKAFSYMTELAKDECVSLKSIAERLVSYAESLEYHSTASLILTQNGEYAKTLAELPEKSDYSNCREEFSKLSWQSLTSARQKKAEKEASTAAENALYETAKDCFNELKSKTEQIAEYYRYDRETANADAEKTKSVFEDLLSLTDDLEDEILRIKVERNAIDFADTELMTVSLLARCDELGRLKRTPLAEEIYRSGRYKMILIDEFQDVNSLQEVIFKAISDSVDMSAIGDNVFCVGDVKQAIYRFRRANPMIFMNTRKQAKSPETRVEEILLTRNFRSRSAVIDFANYVFSSLMTEKLGEVDYTKAEELVRGASFTGEDAPCEIIALDEVGDEVSADEYTAIARKIRSMIINGVKVNDGGELRPCRPSDFCILSRNNISDQKLAESFSAEGLKILSGGVSGYLDSREISLFINLLTVAVSPMRDIAMASVMLSPIMGFNEDEISLVRLLDKKSRLYKNMLVLSADTDNPLSDKCRRAVELIRRMRVYSASLSLTGLVKKLYDVTDIFAMAASYEDGRQKCANLYLLLEYAKVYETSSNDGAAGFLKYIEYIKKSGGDFAEALTVTESDDAVNVKTIHKSKGLEYPFVFLCGLSKKFNLDDIRGRMVLNTDSGVGFSFLDYPTLTKQTNIFYDCIAAKNKNELISEELRLLYVAVTRAKERLFIVLDCGESSVNKSARLAGNINFHLVPPATAKSAVSLQDWLLMALIKHPGFDCIRAKLPFEAYSDDPEAVPPITVSGVLPPQGGAFTGDTQEPPGAVKDLGIKERVISRFAFSNDKRLCSTEAKVSVSELISEDSLNFFPQVPNLEDTVGELSAAQRGVIMHRFMQLADYKNASANLEEEIARLESGGAFTPGEAKSLNRKSLKAFFGGKTYERMSKSLNVMREKSFIVKFSDISIDEETKSAYDGTDGMLQGIADCIFEERDGYVIVDYKTDRVNSLEELKALYEPQLILYKAAFDILLDKPVKSCYIYSYRLADGIEVGLE